MSLCITLRGNGHKVSNYGWWTFWTDFNSLRLHWCWCCGLRNITSHRAIDGYFQEDHVCQRHSKDQAKCNAIVLSSPGCLMVFRRTVESSVHPKILFINPFDIYDSWLLFTNVVDILIWQNWILSLCSCKVLKAYNSQGRLYLLFVDQNDSFFNPCRWHLKCINNSIVACG